MSGRAVRETLAFVGVMASLIFVGLEIRQNTIVAKAAAYQAHGIRLGDSWAEVARNPEYAELNLKIIWDTLTQERLDEMSDVDAHRATVAWVAGLRQFEATWRQVELGLLDPSALSMFGWNSSLGMGIENLKVLWPRVRLFMSPDFAEFLVQTLMVEPTSSP